MSSAEAVAQVLGLSDQPGVHTGPELAAALESGLPATSLERVGRLIAPDDPGFKHRVVARATLARRKRTDRLSLEESERVERLARLWTHALEVWKSEAAARRFLTEEHPLLSGRSPLDMARTEVGARLVQDILGRLEYGSAA